MALSSLIDTVASLKVPTRIVYDMATKVLDTEIFPQHTNTDLNVWRYIHCFVQSGKAFTVKENKNTHTHSHTHTHTHTHTQHPRQRAIIKLEFKKCFKKNSFFIKSKETHQSN